MKKINEPISVFGVFTFGVLLLLAALLMLLTSASKPAAIKDTVCIVATSSLMAKKSIDLYAKKGYSVKHMCAQSVAVVMETRAQRNENLFYGDIILVFEK